jgi:hypothetical protein
MVHNAVRKETSPNFGRPYWACALGPPNAGNGGCNNFYWADSATPYPIGGWSC